MSDFDDEAPRGAGATDDVWDDEPAPAPRSRRQPPADDWDDEWDDEDQPRRGKRDMTLVYAVAAAAIVIVLAVVLTRPQDDETTSGANGGGGAAATTETTVRELQWQGPVGEAAGDIENRIDNETGVFIWTDFQGWHVRSTLDQEVTVVVTADQIVEKGEDGEPTGETTTELTDTIAPGDGSTGIDLDLGFSSNASFTVTVAGAPLPADQIKLGGGTGQADQNPATFTKA